MTTKRKITRKVIPQSGKVSEPGEKISSQVVSRREEVIEEVKAVKLETSNVDSSVSQSDDSVRKERSKRECFFCKSKTIPSYTELASLRRFLTERAKIVGKERTGVCSKHQRGVTKNIKYARHLALLPFVPKV